MESQESLPVKYRIRKKVDVFYTLVSSYFVVYDSKKKHHYTLNL